MKRVLATFHPQAWIDDYAVEIDDGRFTVDVTEQIVAMGKEKALKLKDDSYETDDLVTHDHNGPFWVEVEQSISDFFEV